MKTGTLLAVILFSLVALAHLLRLIFGTEVIVAGTPVPQWVSAVAVVVPAVIAWLLWKESK
ncbi:MAG: hypothetical protein MUE63_14265 [Xanthomonadales bacterium]|jgi:uncharacterized membrane protein|nr:hypothetical protein [Xanthomonadales bacterium]